MIEEKNLIILTQFFKLFSDATRLRIIYTLSKYELCVQHLAQTLNLEQSTVSHQLRVLNHSNIVKKRRDGKMIYYCLNDVHVSTILNQGLEHINEQ